MAGASHGRLKRGGTDALNVAPAKTVQQLQREAMEPPPTDNDWLKTEPISRPFWRSLFTRSKES